MRNLFLAASMFIMAFSIAAQVPTPGKLQHGSMLVVGGTYHIGDGTSIENGYMIIKHGIIEQIGEQSRPSVQETSFDTIIDATDRHIYPGFIALNSALGLREIEAVRASNDQRETGLFTPDARAAIAYNTDSKVIPTIRNHGVLLTQVTPQGGRLSGTSAVMRLDGWNWEDCAIRTDEGIHINWPSYFQSSGWWAAPGRTTLNKDYADEVIKLTDFMTQAETYANAAQDAESFNLKLESCQNLWRGDLNLYIHANHVATIQEAVLWAESFGLHPIIVGGYDASRMLDFLKAHDITVILRPVHSLPVRQADHIHEPYKLPNTLYKAGVPFAFSVTDYWQQRNLPFQAGHAVGFGLPYEAAIQSLTMTAAQIVGIDDLYGSLSPDKSATFFISEGDVLNMTTQRVEEAWIDGRRISVDDSQKALARKFESKYAH